MINNFSNKKIFKFEVSKKKELDKIKENIIQISEKILKKNIGEDLSLIHKFIKLNDLNIFRIKVFEEINKKNLQEKLYKICEDQINFLCSRDIAVQKRINISFHLPNDKASIIDLHSDTLSGQSPFEIVQWIPLCDVEKSNSMYFFDNKKSKFISDNLKKYEKKGYSKILKDNLNIKDYLNVKYGQILFFSPINWHGNSENKTKKSRVSLNLRFKPLFSPNFDFMSKEKGLGSFFRILNLSEASKIGLKYKLPKIK